MQAMKVHAEGPHQEGVVSKGIQERDEMTKNSHKWIGINELGRSTKDSSIPPSLVTGEVSNGSGRSYPEEEMDDEMCDVMRWFFAEENMPNEIKHLTPRSSGSVHSNLPLVLYNNIGKFVANLVKVIQIHSVHVRYKTNSSTYNSSVHSSISNLGLQWYQKPRTQGFVLLACTQTRMAGSFTRYPEFSGQRNEDVEQHWYLCKVIWRDFQTPNNVKVIKFLMILFAKTIMSYNLSIFH